MQRLRSQVGPVFTISVALAILFVLWGAFFTENLSNTFTAVLNYAIATFGWVYLLAVFGFFVFCIVLAFSRLGRIKLGKDEDQPEFTRIGWFSMLFAAGVGLGFLFWGVAEPASHFGSPPYGAAKAGTTEAAELALQYSFLHWGLSAWATYGVVAMAIAYFNFRKDGGNLISAALRPLLGDRVDGPIGKAIDIFAIFAVLFGVATALGIGVLLLNGGLNYVFGIPVSNTVQLISIAVLTIAFMTSAATGISRGILYLSLLNMALAVILLLFILFVGPTVFLLNTFTQSIGQYLGSFFQMSFRAGAFSDSNWAENWTLFYWAWWISWAPFVGTFIARISRGRTVREFVLGVLFVPTLFTFLWFTVFGGSAIYLDLYQGGNVAETAANNLSKSLFDTLTAFPLGQVTSIIALILVSVFFITSADSATFVLGSMSTGGAVNPAAPVKLTWGVVIASFAAVLLIAGGLDALQTATITAAIPFTVVMIGICISLYKALSEEVREPSVESGTEQRRGTAAGEPVGKPAPSTDK